MSDRYNIPRFEDIPEELKKLTNSNIKALRAFELDCGMYKRYTHGYRARTGMITLKIPEKTVLQKIAEIDSERERERCATAHSYLMNSSASSYSYFVNLRETLKHAGGSLNCFNFRNTIGIECALWPNLYPFTDWCESAMSGTSSRHSRKISFECKLFSEIIDYGLHFDLLQWHYDRVIYQIVSGAINTARFSSCSPAHALDTKPFSPTYWQWQHRCLLDAVQQFVLPDVFITISPSEWAFPFAKWIDDIRMHTGKDPRNCQDTKHSTSFTC